MSKENHRLSFPLPCAYAKEMKTSQGPGAHTRNPRYSGGRGQEDCDLRPGLGKKSMRAEGMAQVVEFCIGSSEPEFKPQR
jgi:hypothetical protein